MVAALALQRTGVAGELFAVGSQARVFGRVFRAARPETTPGPVGVKPLRADGISILERLVLSEGQSRLDCRLTATAPMYPTAPATLDGYWLAQGGELQDNRCVVEQRF